MAIPAFFVIVVLLIAGQIVLHNMANPKINRREWDPGRPPYPGLEPYREGDAAVFYGRDQQISDIVRRLLSAPESRLLVIVGASGSGKSSLVQAGVVPVLKARRWVILPVITPGSDPIGNLARAVSKALPTSTAIPSIVRSVRQNREIPERYVSEIRRAKGHRFSQVVLVVDQLEELFTITGEGDRALFLDVIERLLAGDPRVSILASMRIEFLTQFLATDHSTLFQSPIAIGAIRSEYLTTVIEEPGRTADMTFAPNVVDRIVADVGTTDALPLLAYLLQELFFEVGAQGTVTLADYLAAGGVGGALTRQADQAVTELRDEGGIQQTLSTLLRFVSLDANDVTKRPVALRDIGPDQRRIVDAFVDARLLITNVRDGEPVVEVAHEALFRLWAPLRQEVETRAEQLRQRSELERWAADWENSSRSHDYLLTGQRLALAEQWLAGLDALGQAGESVRSLIEHSKRRDLAFLRRVSENIGKYVLANAERFPELSILLSMTALAEAPRTPVVERALMSALAFSHLRCVLSGHSDTVRVVTWSPDGRYLATASRDMTARIFEAASGRSVAVFSGHQAMVEAVAWAPDSRRITTGGRDRTVKVWRLGENAPLLTLYGADDMVRGVAWSPDGRHVAAGSQDHQVHVWRAADGEHLTALRGHSGDVYGLGWSPDGTLLASASHDRTVIVWDFASGDRRLSLRGHGDFVEGLDWSPDGSRLATASGDHTVRIWDVADGRQLLLIRGHLDFVWSVAWSPDGRSVASSSSDRTIRVWDVNDAREIATLRGHDDAVWSTQWSPDGTELASASSDGSARLWSLLPDGAEQRALVGQAGGIRSAAWAAGDLQVATASEDGTVRVWNLAADSFTELDAHTDIVWGVGWAPDGKRLASCANDGLVHVWRLGGSRPERTLDTGVVSEGIMWAPDNARLATAGRDATVSIWDAATGRRLLQLHGHTDWVVRVCWSPSGRMIASTSDDRTARIWDTATGEELAVLRGHHNWVDGVTWSADEETVATCSADWTARLWDARSARHTHTLEGHEGRVRAIAWSPTGDLIATGSYDRTIRLWNSTDGAEVRVAGVHRDRVTSIAWSSDGTRLLSASMDKSARIWTAAPDFDALRRRAAQRVFRELTAEERESHMLAPPVDG
ncbi:hypothetical protein ACN26Y_28270 [Micromonospora sp. WMMD558]|uniref:nSTAND1 domain-containing NTPase n=1 Tax=Micromonospora sp. WMMD558 TaxID=3403462 RepID=UPI003BF6055C